MAELEKEEKEKDWYYAQLQNLTKRIDSLPLTENVNKITYRSFSQYLKHFTVFFKGWSVTVVFVCSSLCRQT